MTDQKDIGSKDELVVPVARLSEPQIIEDPIKSEVMPDSEPVAESSDETAGSREPKAASLG